MHISCFPVSHPRARMLGYIFEEHSRRPFLSEQAEALGVPRGPERRQLVHGQAVTLPDGRVVRPDDVLGDEIPGLKIVQVGDAGRTDNLVEACRGADAW